MPRFPRQPDDVPWPTVEWARNPPGAAVDSERLTGLLDSAFAVPEPPELAETRAVVVVHRGEIVAERYNARTAVDTPLRSWSVAKSVLGTLVGILVDEGRLDLDAPAAVPEWSAPGDPRGSITLRHLLQMQPGLAWTEDYVDGDGSDVIEMLFGAAAHDVAAFAAAKPLVAEPGTSVCYSSGTSNIVARLVGRTISADPSAFEWWARHALFDRIGMSSVSLGFDDAGTWVGSSYLWATAHDWARFGLLHLRGGVWEAERIVSEGWVALEATRSGVDEDGDAYGAHWWVLPDPPGTFTAVGYEHQYVRVVPAHDLVVVRLGKTPTDRRPHVRSWLAEVTACFDTGA